MNEEKYLIQDDSSEHWKTEHPEEFSELEKKFNEMYGNNKEN